MENKNNIWLYNNIDLKEGEELIGVNWSRKRNIGFSNIHSISSYLAMFAPSLPNYFINKYSVVNDTVMDNFSGRGTTALVSREMSRNFVGTDLNPYALALSKFKVGTCKKKKLLKKIYELEIEFKNSQFIYETKINDYEEMQIYYSNKTLSQLIFLREKIGKKWRSLNFIDNAILVYALGLMHGPSKKDGTSTYFSISMPNTISMSPNYVKNYAKKNNLICPNSDVFELLINRINYKFDDLLEKKYNGKIYEFDSTKKNKKIKNGTVSLVITSPPYLNIVNYKTSNWLKLWLMGYDRKNLNKDIMLSDNLKFDEYVIFIKNYLNAIYKKIKVSGKICLIVGDVNHKKLIEDVWKIIEKDVSYNFVEIYYDNNYLQNHKVTNMLNNKKGKSTIIEKVLVLEKK